MWIRRPDLDTDLGSKIQTGCSDLCARGHCRAIARAAGVDAEPLDRAVRLRPRHAIGQHRCRRARPPAFLRLTQRRRQPEASSCWSCSRSTWRCRCLNPAKASSRRPWRCCVHRRLRTIPRKRDRLPVMRGHDPRESTLANRAQTLRRRCALRQGRPPITERETPGIPTECGVARSMSACLSGRSLRRCSGRLKGPTGTVCSPLPLSRRAHSSTWPLELSRSTCCPGARRSPGATGRRAGGLTSRGGPLYFPYRLIIYLGKYEPYS